MNNNLKKSLEGLVELHIQYNKLHLLFCNLMSCFEKETNVGSDFVLSKSKVTNEKRLKRTKEEIKSHILEMSKIRVQVNHYAQEAQDGIYTPILEEICLKHDQILFGGTSLKSNILRGTLEDYLLKTLEKLDQESQIDYKQRKYLLDCYAAIEDFNHSSLSVNETTYAA